MLNEANLPRYFWAEAVNTACFTQNRSLINKFHQKTPYEIWRRRTPNIAFLKIFGCKCYVLYTGQDYRGKFDEKADEGIFVGYAKHSKAYRVFNKISLKIVESVHISFDESNLLEPKVPCSSNEFEFCETCTPSKENPASTPNPSPTGSSPTPETPETSPIPNESEEPIPTETS